MTTNFTLERAREFAIILKSTVQQDMIPIENIFYAEGRNEPDSWNEYKPGTYWGKHDTWYRFKTTFAVPEKFDGKCVKLYLRTGREGLWSGINPQFLVRVNGRVICALDTNHQAVPIAESAVLGDTYNIEFEAYSGRESGNLSFADSPLKFNLFAYRHEKSSEQLYYDIYAAMKTAELYPETDYRRIRIEEYLTKAMNLLDFKAPLSKEYFESIEVAHKFMDQEFYGKFCGESDAVANCIGHTHIDVAWLWQLAQTRAKAVRSFATEISLLKEYPEHRFSSSQPQLYQFVKEDCPELYAEIKQMVKEGRWEAEGAMWLESDCNLVSGESLIRQILHGKRFMKQEFDTESHILWLPDVFGYNAALPQILKKSGVDTFVTSKLYWNETNCFPYDTFIWQGIDGSSVFSQFITAGNTNAKLSDGNTYSTYCGTLTPASLAKGWELYKQKNINNEFITSFGHGDGGGGVTREMLELQRRLKHGIPGAPKTRITSMEDAIARIKSNVQGKKVPKWVGELYFEYHRGTYTSMAKIKKYNRISEFLLQHTESVTLTDKLLLSGSYDKDDIYNSWTTVLLNQFHDILPGSSIAEVYDDAEKQYLTLIEENTNRSAKALKALADNVNRKGIFVYNPTGIKQSGIIDVDGEKYYVEDVPSLGYKVAEPTYLKENGISVSEKSIENRFFKIKLDKTGAITSIFDKRNNREVLSGRANVLYAYDDHPRAYDNWEISNYYKESCWEIDNIDSIGVEEDNVSASVCIKRKFLNSEINQKITLYSDIERIDFDLTTDWKEHHILVKTAFPVDVLSDKAAYEIPYGALERPTHTNTSWDAAKFEVCGHKWADLSETGYGVALLNDCKYGYDIHDGVMSLSLIKCGTNPNPNADIGYHEMRYSLMPHSDTWQNSDVVKQGFALNCPLIALKTEGNGALAYEFSLASCNAENVIVTVAKEACDSEDIILRAYESIGKRTKALITTGFGINGVSEINMIETEVYGELSHIGNSFTAEFRPFEIKTFRIKR